MGEWQITVTNKTGDDGMTPVVVDFMLFQAVPRLTDDSWSSAWAVAEFGYPSTVGPLTLPTTVEFSVLDECYGSPRQSGPYHVEFGKTIVEVKQEEVNSAPVIEINSTDETYAAPEGEIKVVNKAGNPKPLEFALYKDGRKILSYKDVKPGITAQLAIKPTIYIAYLEKDSMGSMYVGKDFPAHAQSESDSATEFPLHSEKLSMTIGVFQKQSGEIHFELVPNEPWQERVQT